MLRRAAPRAPRCSAPMRRSYAVKARPLEGRTALVTGSTSGIGLGIATALAKEGASIMLNGLGSAAEIKEIQTKLADTYKVAVKYSDANLLRADAVEKLVQDTVAELKSIDILVNNADEFPLEMYEKIIALNQNATFYAMRAAIPFMKKAKWGRIVNIASVHGKVASANKAPYVASKHAVIGMTKAAALENCRNGITVNAICPGWVLTPLVEKQIHAKQAQENVSYEEASSRLLAEKQPSRQFATPKQIGECVAFLCSDSAAQITGVDLTIDGGWTAQ